jgi:hypothetical protein
VGTVAGIAKERADLVLVSLVLPPLYLGLYSIAVTLPAAVAVIGSYLAVIALPAITTIGRRPTSARDWASSFAQRRYYLLSRPAH